MEDVVDFVKFANAFKMSLVNTIKEVSISKLPLSDSAVYQV